MENKNAEESKISTGCSLLILAAVAFFVLAPCIGGWAFSSGMIDANKAGCQMLQSGLQQVNPLPLTAPRTAADCINAVDAQSFFFRFVMIVGAYIFAGFFLALMYVLSIIFRMKKTAPPPTDTATS